MNTSNTSPIMRRLLQTAIVGTLGLTCSTLSMAAEPGTANQVVVKFGDLNLSNPQGAGALYSRIVAAAGQACNPFHDDTRDLAIRASVNSCVREAVMDAVTKVVRPELFAVYEARNHAPISIIAAARQTR